MSMFASALLQLAPHAVLAALAVVLMAMLAACAAPFNDIGPGQPLRCRP